MTGKICTMHIKERGAAAIKAMFDIKMLHKLSLGTALHLFYIKVVPIVSYAVNKIPSLAINTDTNF